MPAQCSSGQAPKPRDNIYVEKYIGLYSALEWFPSWLQSAQRPQISVPECLTGLRGDGSQTLARHRQTQRVPGRCCACALVQRPASRESPEFLRPVHPRASKCCLSCHTRRKVTTCAVILCEYSRHISLDVKKIWQACK